MSLLFQVLRSCYCRSTHHRLALDAVTLLRGPRALRWQSVFLRHYRDYLEGAVDPDTVFRDFENHVLHVQQGYWGGACERARYWYEATVRALQARHWGLAAYNAGVLSHYATDPMMPLHTAHSPAETNLHKALEWSIWKTYDPIWNLTLDLTGLPQVEPGRNESWLEELVTAGAEIANRYCDPLLEQFDFAAAAKHPPKGLPLGPRQMIGQMLAFATVSLARILERACAEAAEAVEPPLALPSLDWLSAALEVPLEWPAQRQVCRRNAALVRAQQREFVRTGAVSAHLTEDVRVIRDLCGNQAVPADPLPFAPTAIPLAEFGTTQSKGAERPAQPPEKWLGLCGSTPVERAPSVGPQVAAHLAAFGIRTVADLLGANPARLAAELQLPFLDEAALRDCQDECRLMLDLPRLRNRDAQILVGAGYRSAGSITGLHPEHLLMEVEPFLNSDRGAQVLGDQKRPGLREATQWIGSAEERAFRAADPELAS